MAISNMLTVKHLNNKHLFNGKMPADVEANKVVCIHYMCVIRLYKRLRLVIALTGLGYQPR